MARKKDQQRYLTALGQRRFQKQLRRKGRHYGDHEVPLHDTNRQLPDYPENLDYIIQSVAKMSPLTIYGWQGTAVIPVPEHFSLTEKPEKSYAFIVQLISQLHYQTCRQLIIDYEDCQKIDIDAQVLLDIILKGFISFFNVCKARKLRPRVLKIDTFNMNNEEVRKILFSIGSMKVIRNEEINYPDIIPYHLCIGNKGKKVEKTIISSQKEIDITKLVDYILSCLKKVKKELTPEATSDLCQVIGEILINAEEHSTLRYRYSIGYYQDRLENGRHSGFINLVILNFGQTIYEKFKDPACPTQHLVERMKTLSKTYTKNNLFSSKKFEEETLWTLYALQEGVTTKVNYQKRGNGSIRFIESFFNLRGGPAADDSVSKLTILSGNAKITVDGCYPISLKTFGKDSFKVITFNASGSIEDAPDQKKVTFVDHYFPGTMIYAKILVQDDDFIQKTANAHDTANH